LLHRRRRESFKANYVYIPEKFRETRPEMLQPIMQAHPLATLVVATDGGIVANHIPVMTIAEPKPLGRLRGHIARANPLWKHYRSGGEALAIFHGPDAYISPNYYPTKQQTGEVVPTWNYAIVQARGTLEFTHDAEWLLELVGNLTTIHEAAQPHAWKVDDAPREYTRSMLGLIVGFEFTVTDLVGKLKLSQNRALEDRQGVLEGLNRVGDSDSLEMAGMMDLK
jgi:transcriptional regulator